MPKFTMKRWTHCQEIWTVEGKTLSEAKRNFEKGADYGGHTPGIVLDHEVLEDVVDMEWYAESDEDCEEPLDEDVEEDA